MTNSKFNSQRAYKIIKIIVIILTLVFLIKGYYDFAAWYDWPKFAQRFSEKSCNTRDVELNPHCKNEYYIAAMEVGLKHGNALKIDIGILVILWGGIGLYKYLFPIKKNKE